MTQVERLRTRVKDGPDPEGAVARVERFVAACAEHGGIGGIGGVGGIRGIRGIRGIDGYLPDQRAIELLSLLAGQSAYLTATLIRDPTALLRLLDDPYLEREKSAAVMLAELTEAVRAQPLEVALRRYRNAEYLRLGARELGLGPPAEVARELAHLADACLEVAARAIDSELSRRHGPPMAADGQRCRFVIFGMGKHGGEELNFCSDIDILYIYETDQGAAGELTLHEYFSRLFERLTRALEDVTEDGFCFRVDLRLRPEGARGPLCNSLGAAEHYYEAWGRPWERQAWLKARAVAGDLELGAETLALLEPFIWPRTSGVGAIDAVHELMGKIRAQLAAPDDLKVGPGGIREVEFFVQALQLVHGRLPAVRERSTLRALDKLLFCGFITEREQRELAAAYQLLRRVEHRLQLAEGRQTHALPADDEERGRLARRLGFADRDEFTATLDRHRRAVAEIYTTLGAPLVRAPAVERLLEAGSDRATLREALTTLGFREPESSADEMELLREKPHSPFAPAAADRPVAGILLEEAAASPDPDLALRRLVDLVGRRGAAAGIWRLLAMHRPLARLVVSLFGTSEFLARGFIEHPELLEPLLSAAQARPARSRDELDRAVARAHDGLAHDDEEARLNALRRVRNEELLRIGLFDVAGDLTPESVSTQLSDLAESILEAALAVVAPPTFRKWGTPTTSLAVIALGKLGGRELTYSSDLDLIFVYRDEGSSTGGRAASHFETMSRLAQRFIHALDAYLDEGRLYEVDTRLRPSGQKGALVSSLAGFRAYHAHAAQLWERQALIKARTVAGDRALGAEVEEVAAQHVWSPGKSEGMAEEIGRLRARMEHELACETAHRFNIKTGRGGLLDVEFLVQYLQLREGPSRPALHVRATAPALAALAEAGILERAEADALTASYAFLRRLENRLRIVHDRSIQEISDDPGELEKLARRLGYHGAGAGARLLVDYRAHAERIRAAYARHLPAP